LANLLDRGVIPAERPGQGFMRTFRRDEIMKIALVDRLTKLGMKPTPAAHIAEQFHGAHGVLIVDPDDGISLVTAAVNVPAAITIVDLSRLRREIDSRLAA